MLRGLLLSLAAGLMSALAHPPYEVGWLAFGCLVPFFLASEGRCARRAGWRESALAGYFLGLGQFGGLLYWIAFLPPEEMVYPVLRYPAVMVLVLGLSFHASLFSLLLHWLRSRAGVPLWLAGPLTWSGVEWLRGSTSMGFPWGSLGYALADYPVALQGAAWGGGPPLSAWLVLVNILLAELTRTVRVRERKTIVWATAFCLVLWIPLLAGVAVLRRAKAGDEKLRVALVQPNVAGESKWLPGAKERNLLLLETMTIRAALTDAELIIWPETAATSYLRYDKPFRLRITDAVDLADRPVMGGFLDAEPLGSGNWRTYNAAGLFLPREGLVAIYHKMHLVPFGEEMPFTGLIPALRDLDLGEADFSPGEELVLLEWDRVRAGVLICFEAIFPGLGREVVDGGANLLLNITNDSWFGDSPAPYQHASMAIVRSVETRRPMARCANTGVSLLVDPWGRVLAGTDVFQREILVGSLPLGGGMTIFARWGHIIEPGFGGFALVLGLLSPLWCRRRSND